MAELTLKETIYIYTSTVDFMKYLPKVYEMMDNEEEDSG